VTVAFTLEDGSEIQFDADASAGDGQITRGLLRPDVAEKAVGTFDQVARGLGNSLRVIVTSLREAAEGVDKIKIAFGVRRSV